MSPTRRDILRTITALGVGAALPTPGHAATLAESPRTNDVRTYGLVMDSFDLASDREAMTSIRIEVDPEHGTATIAYRHCTDHALTRKMFTDDPAVVAFLNDFMETPFALEGEFRAKPEVVQIAQKTGRRQEEWKRSKKPCPNECDKGRTQAMDGWMRCQVCNGNGWVI